MFDNIVERYHGKNTAKGHDIKIDETKDGLTLWFLYWDDETSNHHHMGIARITENPNGFSVGWLKGTEPEPYSTAEFSTLDELFAAIDDAIVKV